MKVNSVSPQSSHVWKAAGSVQGAASLSNGVIGRAAKPIGPQLAGSPNRSLWFAGVLQRVALLWGGHGAIPAAVR